jgi:3-phenylpropionate/trans-cinnamate dioxygenase ferredoxin subunit
MIWRKVCKLAELREGEPIGVKLDDMPVGLYRVGERCYALHDVCTHEYVLLSQGYQDGDIIECPLHQAKFNIMTGQCVAAPAREDVAVFPVKVEGDDVLVALP